MADTSPLTSEELRALRQDVALANRIAHKVGLSTAYGHITARVPGTDTFLIPTRASPALAHADRLVLMDLDGNQLGGAGRPNTEFWIHARIYAARPDVGGVAHVHAPACVALAQTGQTLRILNNSAALFSDGVPLFERAGLVRSREVGDQAAERLGTKRGVFLRGHGANLADADIRRVTAIACFVEEAADLQLRALAAVGGDPDRLRYFDQEELARVREELDNGPVLDRAWDYYSALARGELERGEGPLDLD